MENKKYRKLKNMGLCHRYQPETQQSIFKPLGSSGINELSLTGIW